MMNEVQSIPRSTMQGKHQRYHRPTIKYGPVEPTIKAKRIDVSRVKASRTQTSIYCPEPWKAYSEVTVSLTMENVLSTLDLRRKFSAFGKVDQIELLEDKHGTLNGRARVRFRPPPDTAFWEKGSISCWSASKQVDVTVRVQLMRPKETFHQTVASPINSEIRYPKVMDVPVSKIDFGFMYEESTMMRMFSTQFGSRCSFELNLARRYLEIAFVHRFEYSQGTLQERQGLNRTENYRFKIPFVALEKILDVPSDVPGGHAILINLPSPPLFWRRVHDIDKTHSKDSKNDRIWGEQDAWYRQTDVLLDYAGLGKEPLAIKKLKPTIDIGRWTTYRITFDAKDHQSSQFAHIFSALQDWNIRTEDFPNLHVVDDHRSRVWDIIDQVNPVQPFGSFSEELLSFTVSTPLRFPLRYQLEACISQGVLSEYNLTREFIDRLLELEAQEEGRALRLLEYIAETEQRFYNAMEIFDLDYGIRQKDVHIPSYCVLMRKATITPTMIYYSNPVVETSNRVIRQYSHIADHFLRVQFTDEKYYGKISATDGHTSDEVFTRVHRALENGITIGDRHFEFLSFGNSQLRANGAYFFAPTSHETAASIRAWMGDFDGIKQVAKYAARLGQCFSTTRAINSVKVNLQEVPDIERDYKGSKQCFSDGCGQISELVAQFISSELHLDKRVPPPSAFQFRLAGCKGVLAVHPGISVKDKSNMAVCIRPSQKKFVAGHTGLEIIRASQFASASLNRQLIAVLSTLGVSDEVFLLKLKTQLIQLSKAMVDKSAALHLLTRNIDPNQATLKLAALILEGFMQSGDPFVNNLLHLWRAWSIKTLKEKARIVLEEGAFVIGVIDETATLRGHFDPSTTMSQAQGKERLWDVPEIFLQISDLDRPGKFRVIEGIFLLARNPSLHPGDIRTVRAVAKSELMHLRNVVVLPQTGTRALSSMCSGGDLDGDDYIVIWDQDIRPTENNVEPMDYTPPKPKIEDDGVKLKDITAFFVAYMKNDKLGTIAHAHLAWSDKLDDGVKSSRCRELAELHSMAVDFNKTGEPAKMEKSLRPREWPHFMEKYPDNPEKSYKSNKILGQLYDNVQRISFDPSFKHIIDDNTGKEHVYTFDERILNAFDLDDNLKQTARDIKVLHDEAMHRIMAQHNIKTEFEIWSTFVMQHSGVSSDYKFHEEIGAISAAHIERFVLYIEKVLGRVPELKLGKFVAAMYYVTYKEYEEARLATELTKMPLISFPWLYPELLGKIAKGDGIFGKDANGRCVNDVAVQVDEEEVSEKWFSASESHSSTEASASTSDSSNSRSHYDDLMDLKFDIGNFVLTEDGLI